VKARAGALALLGLLERPAPGGHGEERAFATAALESWLGECPSGPLSLGPDAKRVLRALAGGWSSRAIHAVALGPANSAELTLRIGAPRARAVAGALRAMREVGLVESVSVPAGRDIVVPTVWLRRAIGPLAAAARLEIAEPPRGAAPIDPQDVEAAFRLGLSLLLELDEDFSHLCRLTVAMPERGVPLAGVAVQLELGEIVMVTADLRIHSETWASGSPLAWIETLIDPTDPKLAVSGNLEVLLALLHGLHEELFPMQIRGR
jgi:hypothetical protein